MAKSKVYLDSDLNPVAKGSANAAFIFNASDDRIPKFRKQRQEANRLATATPEPEAEEEEPTTERVGARRRPSPSLP